MRKKNTLNPQQQQIIEHTTGPALVIAGAGSGKTLVVTKRVAQLIRQGVPSESIILLTFTNKAAREMMSRIDDELQTNQSDQKRPPIIGGTFHSLSNRYLRRYARHCGYESNFTILDMSDSKEILRLCMVEVAGKKRHPNFPKVSLLQSILSLSFNLNHTVENLIKKQYPWLQEFLGTIQKIQAVYQAKKKTNNAMDFDDLLRNFNEILSLKEPLPLIEQLDYVLVDEFQDTNYIQAQIVDKLAKKHRNLMVVGDDAQSIFGWRGAIYTNILDFPKHYQGTVEYRLETNYRSNQEILDLANASINYNKKQFKKNLVACYSSHEKPLWKSFDSNSIETSWITEKIVNLDKQEVPLSEICICYRSHAHSISLQMELTKNRIPFAVRSGVTFFELAHIKDVLAFLRVIYNSQDEISWNRILKLLPGVGAVTAQKLLLQIQAVQSIHELSSETFLKTVPKKARMKWSDLVRLFQELQGAESVSEMIFAIVTCFYAEIAKSLFENWEDRKDDIATLAGYSSKFDNLNSFLNELSLVGNEDFAFSDTEEKDQEKVVLTTIHQAKGLEWDHVFVIALSEGLFPSGHSLFSDEQTEEERRLFYVAVTRAKKKLYLTSPKNVKIWGQDKHFSVSKFIEEIDENLLYKEPFRKEVTKVYRFE